MPSLQSDCVQKTIQFNFNQLLRPNLRILTALAYFKLYYFWRILNSIRILISKISLIFKQLQNNLQFNMHCYYKKPIIKQITLHESVIIAYTEVTNRYQRVNPILYSYRHAFKHSTKFSSRKPLTLRLTDISFCAKTKYFLSKSTDDSYIFQLDMNTGHSFL